MRVAAAKKKKGWFWVYTLLKLIHAGVTVLSALFLLVRTFYHEPQSNTGSEIAFAIAVVIFSVSTILTWIADQALRNAVFAPDIKQLIEEVHERLNQRREHQYRPNWLLCSIVLATSIAVGGVILIGAEVWMPQPRPVWLAIVAVAAAETIVLAGTFEQVSMKRELEALARTRREKLSVSPMARIDMEIARRASELNAALGQNTSTRKRSRYRWARSWRRFILVSGRSLPIRKPRFRR